MNMKREFVIEQIEKQYGCKVVKSVKLYRELTFKGLDCKQAYLHCLLEDGRTVDVTL